jgi:hypothetical protein
MPHGLDDHLTKQQAAEVLNVTVVRLDGWRWTGRGPDYITLEGREIRYSRAALQQYIQSQTRHPAMPAIMEDRHHGLVSKKG